jgi:glycosyltransferase involved in cell wall biosynthesis
LLAPSLYEGFGLTVVEAMACGLPVIASNRSAFPEVVGDAGVLTEPTDVAAIADAVVRIQQNVYYRQHLIECGLARAKLFNWNQTAEKIAQVYETIDDAAKAVG